MRSGRRQRSPQPFRIGLDGVQKRRTIPSSFAGRGGVGVARTAQGAAAAERTNAIESGLAMTHPGVRAKRRGGGTDRDKREIDGEVTEGAGQPNPVRRWLAALRGSRKDSERLGSHPARPARRRSGYLSRESKFERRPRVFAERADAPADTAGDGARSPTLRQRWRASLRRGPPR